MAIQFNDRLDAIPIYPAARSYAVGGPVAKLASNESPFAPHPAVVQAMADAAAVANRYPDPSGLALREAIAVAHGEDVARVMLGNGSCEILLAAAAAMLQPGTEVVYAWPSFSMYPQLAGMTGATAVEVPLDGEWRHDLGALAAAVTAKTRMLLVCNPNNPTATYLEPAVVAAFIERIPPEVCVIIDEAYVEFAALDDRDALLAVARQHDNMVVLRTFSKVYGLAGVRVGYAFGSPAFKRAIDLVRQPFSVNMVAQAAANAALGQSADMNERVAHTVIEREWVEGQLHGLGLQTAVTRSNFSWINVGERDEDAIVDGLARAGVMVRAGSALGEAGCFRVSYGTREENQRFITELTALL